MRCTTSLGCVRFRSEIISRFPELIDEDEVDALFVKAGLPNSLSRPRPFNVVDGAQSSRLHGLHGLDPHQHTDVEHFQTRLAGLGFAHGAIVPDADFMVMRNWDAPFASPHLAERPVTG